MATQTFTLGHTLDPRSVQVLAERHGLRVIDLGPDVTVEGDAGAVEAFRVALEQLLRPSSGGWAVILRLMMPSRHLLPAANTPDPEFPVVATSLITVENLAWKENGSWRGDIMCERAVPSGTTTITGSPAQGGPWQSRTWLCCRSAGSFC